MINILYIVLIALVSVCPSVFATDGYFMIGYGAKSIGVGGAGVAAPQDRLAGAINPASMAHVIPGFDAGLRLLTATRNGSIDCRGIGACDAVVKDRSARDFFAVPNFGYSHRLSDDITLGVSVYGNGGINTTYGRAFYDETIARIRGGRPGDPGFPRTGKLGIDFSQLFIAPVIAWQFHQRHTIGISPIAALQRFSTRGFETFEGLSTDPTSVSGRGTDYVFGGGVRVGWYGMITQSLHVGAQYTSRIWTGKATQYNGLLANNGEMEAPPHWTIGCGWDATPRLHILFDFQRILWDSIDALSNPGPTSAELAGVIEADRRLGGSEGIGFGWIDQSVFKLGVVFDYNDAVTLRAGWNHASSNIPNHEALTNVPAPATINDNVTLGASWATRSFGEFTVAYMHAFKKSIVDHNTALFGAGVRASIYENTLDLSWARDF